MNILPVAHRELRLLARAPGTYRVRCLTVILATLLSLGMLYAGFAGTLSPASAGRGLFVTLSSIAALYVLIEGSLVTGDSLSREKREGTLGLLFLTDLRGYDVVIGKLISRTGRSAYALLAALPVLGIPLFLGGVSGRDFALVTLALLNGLFFSASWGILVSSLCVKERRALGFALFGTLGLSVLLPTIGWVISRSTFSGGIHPAFLILSPAGAFSEAVFPRSMPGLWNMSFGQSWILAHLLAWSFLLGASFILPRGWRESAFGGREKVMRGESKPGHAVAPGAKRSRPPRETESDALVWSDDNPHRKRSASVVVFLTFLIAWSVGLAFVRTRWLNLPIFAITVAVLHLVLILVALLRVCRGPAGDHANGTLELLLTTPLGEEFYRRGRLLSTKRRLARPVSFLFATEAGLIVAGCWASGSMNWEWLGWFGVGLVFGCKLLLDLYAVAWVGFWQGLATGNTAHAVRKSIFYLFVNKWLILLVVLAAAGIVTRGQFFNSAAGGIAAGLVYILISLATLIHYGGAAISELSDNLRILAVGLSEKAPVSALGRFLQRGRSMRHLGSVLPGMGRISET